MVTSLLAGVRRRTIHSSCVWGKFPENLPYISFLLFPATVGQCKYQDWSLCIHDIDVLIFLNYQNVQMNLDWLKLRFTPAQNVWLKQQCKQENTNDTENTRLDL